MDEQLRQATLGASSQVPASPLGSFPELDKLYQSSFQLAQSTPATNARVNLAQQTLTDQKAATDKVKYQRVKKADGGYAFFDPSGKEVSAYDYANAVGAKPSEVLADSENPIDIGYQEDYNNLQDYMQAKLNAKTNSTLAAKAKSIEDQVKKAHGVDLSGMNPQQLIDSFKSAYPTVYGRSNTGVQAGQTFIPQYDANTFDPANPSGDESIANQRR